MPDVDPREFREVVNELADVSERLMALELRLNFLFDCDHEHKLEIPGLEGFKLTRGQRAILRVLSGRLGGIVRHDQLHAALYAGRDEAREPEQRVMNTHMVKLRRAIRKSTWTIETVHGLGYRLVRKKSRPDKLTSEAPNVRPRPKR